MASPISPPGSVRRGGRYLPRRSTKGPLDSAEEYAGKERDDAKLRVVAVL